MPLTDSAAQSIFGGGGSSTSQPTGAESFGQGLSNIGKNIVPSAKGVISAIGNSIMHPIQTVKSLGNLALGAVSPNTAGGDLNPKTGEPVPVTQSKAFKTFNSFGENFLGGALYGNNVQGAWQKLQKDPVGFATDLAVVGDAATQLGKTVGVLSDSSKLTEAAKLMTPAQAPFETMSNALERMSNPRPGVAENVATANELGIQKPPLQAITTSPTIQRVSQFITEGLFGKGLKDSINTAKTVLDSKVNEVIGNLPKGLEDPVLGQKLADAKSTFEQTFESRKNALYNNIEKNYGEIGAPAEQVVQGTHQAIQNQINILKKSATPDANKEIAYLQKTDDALMYGKENLANLKAGLKQAEEKGINLDQYGDEIRKGFLEDNPHSVTFNDLKATRSSIGAKIGAENANSWIYKPVYKALSQDRDTLLGNVAPDAASKIKELDTYYKSTLDKLGTNASSIIDKASPEQVVKTFVRGNNSTTLNALKDVVDKETYNNIGLSWIKDSINKSTDSVTGKLDINKMVGSWNKLDEPTKNALFTGESVSKMNEAMDTLQKVQKIQDNLNKFSGSGGFMRNSMTIRAMGLPLTMALGGSKFLFTYLAGMGGGEFLGAKILNSELGKALLATGGEGIKTTANVIGKTGEVAGATSKVGNIEQETRKK